MFSSIETLTFIFIDIAVLFAFTCPVILQKQEMKSCRRSFLEFRIDLTKFLIKHLVTSGEPLQSFCVTVFFEFRTKYVPFINPIFLVIDILVSFGNYIVSNKQQKQSPRCVLLNV